MDALHSAFRSELHTCSLRRTSLNFINLRIDLRRSPELEQQNRAEYHMFEHTHQKYVHLLMASHFLSPSLHHASAPPESLKWFGCKIPADCHINAARMIDARSHTLDNRLKKETESEYHDHEEVEAARKALQQSVQQDASSS